MIAIMLFVGCNHRTNSVRPADSVPNDNQTMTYASDWNERNSDIYRFLFAKIDEPTPDRIYFITTTPMAEWGDEGNWSTIPADVLAELPHAASYRPASEAHLQDSHVRENGTNAKAWMRWISVKRWISETEVEVEDGVWCCPLGGGASTSTYEKVDGEWRVKEHGRMWVS